MSWVGGCYKIYPRNTDFSGNSLIVVAVACADHTVDQIKYSSPIAISIRNLLINVDLWLFMFFKHIWKVASLIQVAN